LASLSEEREELISILERNFPDFERSQFRWRHDRNPAGPAWAWVLYDRESGAIGGMTLMFPRPMYLDGKLVMCGQVSQFAIDNAFRSLGPALMLQRATFEPVDSGLIAMCYDCPPHEQGMSTFLRLGMRPSCALTRFAVPLRSDDIVEARFGRGMWTRPLVAGANLLLALRRGKHHSAGLQIVRFGGRFGDEFTELDRSVPSVGTIRSSRSAELLNWRYCDRADSQVEVLIARRGGELLAFLAFSVYERHGHKRACLCDLFGQELQKAGTALLDAAIEVCRRMNVVCLEGHCSETSELRPLFEAAGFRAREVTARVVPYAKAGVLDSLLAWPMGQAELLA
jgi:GNAT superfamily N-acetyltransferase